MNRRATGHRLRNTITRPTRNDSRRPAEVETSCRDQWVGRLLAKKKAARDRPPGGVPNVYLGGGVVPPEPLVVVALEVAEPFLPFFPPLWPFLVLVLVVAVALLLPGGSG